MAVASFPQSVVAVPAAIDDLRSVAAARLDDVASVAHSAGDAVTSLAAEARREVDGVSVRARPSRADRRNVVALLAAVAALVAVVFVGRRVKARREAGSDAAPVDVRFQRSQPEGEKR